MSDTQPLTDHHILVVDDDSDIRGLIVDQLRMEQYRLSDAASLAEMRIKIAEEDIDLVVLDLSLPDGDGLNECRALRAQGWQTPVIMVTARGSPVDRVLGLELGADDYLNKPFEPRELLARIRNLLRRRIQPDTQSPASSAHFAILGPWRLDLLRRRLIAPDGALIILSAAEFKLLKHFVDKPNIVLSREELLPERSATVAFDRSIDLQISRLRQKMSRIKGGDDLILTVRNEGYILTCIVQYE